MPDVDPADVALVQDLSPRAAQEDETRELCDALSRLGARPAIRIARAQQPEELDESFFADHVTSRRAYAASGPGRSRRSIGP